MTDLILEPFATQMKWQLPEARPIQDWEAMLREFVGLITDKCSDQEKYLIGHIKGFSAFPEGGHLRFSVVSPTHPVDLEIVEADPKNREKLSVTLNVIVYGLSFEEAKIIVEESAQSVISQRTGEIIWEAISDPEHESHDHS